MLHVHTVHILTPISSLLFATEMAWTAAGHMEHHHHQLQQHQLAALSSTMALFRATIISKRSNFSRYIFQHYIITIYSVLSPCLFSYLHFITTLCSHYLHTHRRTFITKLTSISRVLCDWAAQYLSCNSQCSLWGPNWIQCTFVQYHSYLLHCHNFQKPDGSQQCQYPELLRLYRLICCFGFLSQWTAIIFPYLGWDNLYEAHNLSVALHVDQWFASCRSRPFPNWPVRNSFTHNNEI